jgi:two-component system, OmpR family, response regulator ChvI
LRVLLVDDEGDVLESVKRGLESRGFEVDAFDDPAQALNQFRKGAYGFILLDVRMPRMNGFQLYRELLKRDGDVRVKFFTAFEEYREEFKKAFPELDEKRFIRKPTTISNIAELLLREVKATQAKSLPTSEINPRHR